MKPRKIQKNRFSVKLIVLLVVKFDFSLMSTIVKFTFTSLGNKDFNIKLISLTSYIPTRRLYPVVDVGVFSRSNISIISSYVSWNQYTISSGSLFFRFFLFPQVFHF